MNRFYAVIPMFAVLLLAAGCKSDPVAPTSYTGTNGVLFSSIAFSTSDTTSKSYQNLVADFGKSSVEFIDPLDIQHGVQLGGYMLEGKEIEMTLALPASISGKGEFAWADGAAPTTDSAYVIVTRDEHDYTSVSGKTIITKYGGAGQSVEGTFHGTIHPADGGALTTIDGRFTATRVN